jgi:xanthine dehydrogenase YagS FAD-binding subunit
MQAFSYVRATDVDSAIQAAQAPGAMFLGGGTNLIDLAKGNIAKPQRLIDINGLPLAEIAELPDGGVRIGALARNSDTANHPLIRRRYPLLSQALLAGASPQLRNMATTGGNLLQRTRCYYFTDAAFSMCNKRIPGSGCAALQGQNRIHAIFGASDQCVAVNPSDMNVALAALDAVVQVRGAQGARAIPIAEFHRLPGATPQTDTTLIPGELILSVDLPANGFAAHSNYLKVRDRASYAFALVSVAAALELQDGMVKSARVVLGGVAHKPWRPTEAERMLTGKRLERAGIEAAAAAAVRDAKPLHDNAFKPELARRAIVRALQTAGGLA